MISTPPYSVCPLLGLIPALCWAAFTSRKEDKKKRCLVSAGPLLQPKVVLSHVSINTTILGYCQQFLSVTTQSPWLAPQPVGVWNIHISPLSYGAPQRGAWNTSALAFANKAENFVPCPEKVIPDTFSCTVQVLLPQAGLGVEGFVSEG